MKTEKEPASNRCAVQDCPLPRQLGDYLCLEHKPKPLSLREAIAAGPRFDRVKANAVCPACGDLADFDMRTGLCVSCWRAHRFSMHRQ